jgi:hypothetical protein
MNPTKLASGKFVLLRRPVKTAASLRLDFANIR